MPLKIIRQDITKIKCDAIVNPTDPKYSHGGGVDEAIHTAAGEELSRACLAQKPLGVGEAVMTPAFALPCRHVIHTVGPRWLGGSCDEEALLRTCYKAVLALAESHNCRSLAIPLIASGTFGFPKDRVLKIAVDVIGDFLLSHDMLVYIVVYDKSAYAISEKLFSDVISFLGDACVDNEFGNLPKCSDTDFDAPMMCQCAPIGAKTLEDMLREMGRGFAETLFSYIDQKGMTDVECYKRANVDKKTFSKIKCNKNYKPSKITALSFAIALRLNLEETTHLLNTIGMSLSRSSKFDVIIEYFITTGNYKNIFDVNETLYQFDQVTLGV